MRFCPRGHGALLPGQRRGSASKRSSIAAWTTARDGKGDGNQISRSSLDNRPRRARSRGTLYSGSFMTTTNREGGFAEVLISSARRTPAPKSGAGRRPRRRMSPGVPAGDVLRRSNVFRGVRRRDILRRRMLSGVPAGRHSPASNVSRGAGGRHSPALNVSRCAGGRRSPASNVSRCAADRRFPAGNLSRCTAERRFPAGNLSRCAAGRRFPAGNLSPLHRQETFFGESLPACVG